MKRGAWAAGAGLAATGVFFVAFVALVAGAFFSINRDAAPFAVAIVAATVLIVAGGALPARALGAGWRRSLLISAASTAGPPLSLLLSSLDDTVRSVLLYIFAFASPAIVVIVAGDGMGFTGTVFVAALAALLILAFLAWSYLWPGVARSGDLTLFAKVIAGWTMLPALAGLLQHGSGAFGD